MSAKKSKQHVLREWQAALAWHRHMVKLSLRAYEYRRKSESLLAKLCIVNMGKVIK